MNRRLCVLRLGSALLTVPTWQAWAQGSAPTGLREGKDYLALRTPAPTDVPAGKVEVLEFFSYNCPHCAALEPSLEAWSKKLPADAVLRRVPVPFIGDAEVKQRLYYTLEAMGKLGELHGKVFDAIHRQRINLSGEKATLDWLAKQGVDTAKYREIAKSFSIAGKLRRATQLTDAYRVEGVPAFGVGGRYYTDGTLAGSLERALQVVDALIVVARKPA